MRRIFTSLASVPEYMRSTKILAIGVIDAVSINPLHDVVTEVWVTEAGRIKIEFHMKRTESVEERYVVIEHPSRARASLVGVRNLNLTVGSELEKFF